MKTSIRNFFALPAMIASVWMINNNTAFGQGAAAPAAAPAALQTFLNALGGGGQAGGAARGGGAGNGAFAAASLVTVVADTVGNNLIISAPEEILKQIDTLIETLDKPSVDTTQIKAFFLRNSSPSDIVTELTALFPDPNAANNRGGARGGGFNFATANAGTSARILTQQKVVAVADLRTSSVIVSASSAMMGEIERVINEIDSDPRSSLSTQVKVFSLKGDVTQPQLIIQTLFGATTTQNTQNNAQNPLNTRSAFLNSGGAAGGAGATQNAGAGRGGN